MNKILEHKHIIIRAEVSEPITKRNKAIKFLNRIIKAIDMKAMDVIHYLAELMADANKTTWYLKATLRCG